MNLDINTEKQAAKELKEATTFITNINTLVQKHSNKIHGELSKYFVSLEQIIIKEIESINKLKKLEALLCDLAIPPKKLKRSDYYWATEQQKEVVFNCKHNTFMQVAKLERLFYLIANELDNGKDYKHNAEICAIIALLK